MTRRTRTPRRPVDRTALHDLISASPELRGSTKKQYLADLDKYLAFVGTDPKAWTRANTSKFYAHLLGEEEMLPQSANRVMASVQYASKWFASRANDGTLEFAEIQLAHGRDRAGREALTDEDLIALLSTCHFKRPRDLRDFAMMVLTIETGARRASVIGSTWESIQAQPYLSMLMALKGIDAPFAVPLSDTARQALGPWEAWLKRKQEPRRGHIFRKLVKVEGGARLGEPLTPAAFYEMTRARSKVAGLAPVHPHLFRHTFITGRLAAGFTPFQIAAITGHRLPGNWGGNLYTYSDKKVLGEQIRNSTPAWLTSYVRKFCG